MTSRLLLTGRLNVHPRGFGFIEREGGEGPRSAYVAAAELQGLLAGDRVRAEVSASPDGRWSARRLELVERTRELLFGEVRFHGGKPWLVVDREVATHDRRLETDGEVLTEGESVVARIEGDTARLVRRIDPAADASLERVIVRHGLRTRFSDAALEEAARACERAHVPAGRRDLRELPTVTIDSAATRDIDDAVSVLPAGGDGALRLFVSIADASEFVPEGSALDEEARGRATSVYLAGRLIPMLPEALSTDWISLKRGQDRLCLTVEMRIDPEGRITAADVYESIIRSWARLTYREVAEWLDRGELSKRMEPVREALPWLRAAAARLGVARSARGGIELAREEARFRFDEAGEVMGIEPVKPTPAHTLIERFMVAANEAIATWLASRGVPALFRVHERPDPEHVAELQALALHSGFAAGFGPELTPLALAAFDRQITGCAAEPAMRALLLRSLGPSYYTAQAGSHFGLAAPAYLHFTSPIRRYADLSVHRAVKQYLRGRRDFEHRDPAMERLAVHVNDRARRASLAERDRRRILEARVMRAHLGEEFPARVTRVKPFGLVVQLESLLVEGTVPLESLPPGPWRLDDRETALTGPERTFTVGMPLRVRVTGADELLGRVELAFVDAPQPDAAAKRV